MVAENLEKKKENKSNEKRKEPWWKKKILANIPEWRKDVTRLNDTFEFEKKELDRMERMYQLSDLGNFEVIDMLKKNSRCYIDKKVWRNGATLPSEHFFGTNQKKLSQEIEGCSNIFEGRSNIPNKAPDSLEASEFWSNIWSMPGMISSEINKQEDIITSVENVKTTIRKMTNWKTPGPDCV